MELLDDTIDSEVQELAKLLSLQQVCVSCDSHVIFTGCHVVYFGVQVGWIFTDLESDIVYSIEV